MSQSRTNQEWLHHLNANGMLQEAAIADLRDILLRAALFFFSQNLGDFAGLSRDEILQHAEDCAQDALIAVMHHLADFRGDSKFSTWAYKFAINKALMTARRQRCKGISLDELSDSGEGIFSKWMIYHKSDGIAPEQSAIQDELRGILWDVIQNELTHKQRQVLLLMIFHEVPMDEVVRHLGTNRNAIYKLLHDARCKLKSGLQTQGFEVSEIITLFDTMR